MGILGTTTVLNAADHGLAADGRQERTPWPR
jgi:hypothetical protein